MRRYTVRLWFNCHEDVEVEAENAEEAWKKVRETMWEDVVIGADELEFDTYEMFDDKGDVIL